MQYHDALGLEHAPDLRPERVPRQRLIPFCIRDVKRRVELTTQEDQMMKSEMEKAESLRDQRIKQSMQAKRLPQNFRKSSRRLLRMLESMPFGAFEALLLCTYVNAYIHSIRF